MSAEIAVPDPVPAETSAVEPWREPLAALEYARTSVAAERDLAKLEGLKEYGMLLKAHGHARKLGAELQGDANEIINRSERRLGQLLAETPKAKGGNPTGANQHKPGGTGTAPAPVPTPHQQAGKKASAQAQQKAGMPEERFEDNARRAPTRVARIARNIQAEQRRQEQAVQPAAELPPGIDLRHGDFREAFPDLEGVDAVITDPPYGQEYVPLLADLARWADRVLTPDGILVVLYGQTWLPEAFAALSGGRPYRWTACYTAGGNTAYVSHARRVHCGWKPLLVYGGGPRFADMFTASAGRDGQHHKWGQDYQGFAEIVQRLTAPGQTVADPFLGGGTTLLAAWHLGRHVAGCDVDENAMISARQRFQPGT